MTLLILSDSTAQATCERCGFYWEFSTRYLSRDYNTQLCRSCNAKPATSVHSKRIGTACRPWTGDLDDNLNPIKNKALYLPGVRLCGFKDCVNKNHIEAAHD